MKKLHAILTKVYGVLMTTSFFGGILPLIPYIIAMIIGGTTGEAIAVFIYKQVYPWIIAMGSVAALVGLVDVYVEKIIKRMEAKKQA